MAANLGLAVSVVTTGMDRKLKAADKATKKAAVRAINRTAVTARSEASKEIRKDVRFRASYIKSRTKIQNASAGRLQAVITARARGTRLDRFNHTEKRKPGGGVSVTVKRSSGRQFIRGAFLVNLDRGGGGVAIAHRFGRRRQFEVLYTTSVHNAYKDVAPEIEKRMEPVLSTRFRRELKFQLARI